MNIIAPLIAALIAIVLAYLFAKKMDSRQMKNREEFLNSLRQLDASDNPNQSIEDYRANYIFGLFQRKPKEKTNIKKKKG